MMKEIGVMFFGIYPGESHCCSASFYRLISETSTARFSLLFII